MYNNGNGRYPVPKRKGIPEICTEDANERRRESLMKVLNLTRSLNLKQPSRVSSKQFVYQLDNNASSTNRRGKRQDPRAKRVVNPALSSRGPALCPSTAYITMMKLCDRLENDIRNELAAQNIHESQQINQR